MRRGREGQRERGRESRKVVASRKEGRRIKVTSVGRRSEGVEWEKILRREGR